jgi:hypothetical protein
MEQSNAALNNALHLMTEKVGSIQTLHDHSQRTHVEVMDKSVIHAIMDDKV